MSKISKITKQLQKQYKPVGDISDVSSLEDNFIYSILINSKHGEEIQGFSPIELSKWLQDKGLKTDYQVLQYIFL